MAFLNRDKLLAKRKLKIEKVDLGNGDHVFVREMTGGDKNRLEVSLLREVKHKDGTVEFVSTLDSFRSKLLVVTVCDKDGNLIFKPDDWKLLDDTMTAEQMLVIFNAAQELNSMTEAGREELAKNLDAALEGGSTSG